MPNQMGSGILMIVKDDVRPPGAFSSLCALVASTARVLADFAAAPLTPVETERASRLRGQARADFLAAHALVRHCAARLIGWSAADVVIEQHCEQCGGVGHGRPRIPERPDIHLSLAHSRGVVAAAASWSPVGIDLEALPLPSLRIEEVAGTLSPAELAAVQSATVPAEAFVRYWIRKEALVKVGTADLDGLGTIDLAGLTLASWSVPRRRHRFGDWQILDWSDGALGALGALVTCFDAGPVDVTALGPG